MNSPRRMLKRIKPTALAARAYLTGFPTAAQLRRGGAALGSGLKIGSRCYIDTVFPWAITIGDDVTLSWDVTITAHDAAMWPALGYTVVRPVSIGSRAYVGAGATILAGCSIGEGAVVGAGSVVSGDVDPHSVVAGNPARRIGSVDDLVGRHREACARSKVDVTAAELTASDLSDARELIGRHGYVYVR